MSPRPQQITQLLQAWGDGDEHALDKLVPLVQGELHKLAHRYMARERRGHTLQTTALVNEVYLRLVRARDLPWQDRAHFFAICAQSMRRILTDYARSRRYAKRGGGAHQVSLDEAPEVSRQPRGDLVALDDALNRLATVDELPPPLAGHGPWLRSLATGMTPLFTLCGRDGSARLAEVDERKSRVVELRYFGGLSVEETAEVLKVSPETVMRDWKLAKAWLLRELSGEQRDES